MEFNKPWPWIRIVMALTGVGLMLATVPIFFPAEFMATCHRWLGLGDFPNQPITLYLARSTSLLYAIHGFILTYVAWHFSRNQRFAPVLGWLHVVTGAMLLGIDWSSGMPAYWTFLEGPGVAAMGLVMVWLANRHLGLNNLYGESDDARSS